MTTCVNLLVMYKKLWTFSRHGVEWCQAAANLCTKPNMNKKQQQVNQLHQQHDAQNTGTNYHFPA